MKEISERKASSIIFFYFDIRNSLFDIHYLAPIFMMSLNLTAMP